jgi:hypothetical protein
MLRSENALPGNEDTSLTTNENTGPQGHRTRVTVAAIGKGNLGKAKVPRPGTSQKRSLAHQYLVNINAGDEESKSLNGMDLGSKGGGGGGSDGSGGRGDEGGKLEAVKVMSVKDRMELLKREGVERQSGGDGLLVKGCGVLVSLLPATKMDSVMGQVQQEEEETGGEVGGAWLRWSEACMEMQEGCVRKVGGEPRFGVAMLAGWLCFGDGG